mmetsp:Transcript_23759/g.33240  ORF Transcript_23759/g.33240 Transcript_23759/m.33240 type:complete len:441 (+) Transcript_23759:173-1495(+)|eukprot:CAMPEP_0184488350 /NCGR_PEP_ID=MMETSP0113_2-20130426/11433_1 /TAXON_ID=91329 /ORGANISM="Norrisiella sphaerica, Strain BC52" /LENGTH=440 /DNA_ID=CAMNT_0026871005 /DNA_START=131 /DNA_END=1453 /DNA_ORIENTATION=-
MHWLSLLIIHVAPVFALFSSSELPTRNGEPFSGEMDDSSFEMLEMHSVHALSASYFANHSYYVVRSAGNLYIEPNEKEWIPSTVSHVDDTPPEEVRLNFTFPFYGHNESRAFIDPNGFLTFIGGQGCSQSGFCGWSSDSDANYIRWIAPLMTDLNPSNSADGKVMFQLGETNGKSRLAVTWKDVTLWSRPKFGAFTFQTVIFEDGTIYLSYWSLPFDPDTVFIQGRRGTRFHFPLYIGSEDASIREGEAARRYGKISIPFSAISTSQTIVMTPVLSCSGPKTCQSCSVRRSEVEGRLDCAWCAEKGVCTDTEGRDYSENTKAGCSPDRFRRNVFQCSIKEEPGFCGTDPEALCGVKQGSVAIRHEVAEASMPIIPIFVGIAVGLVFFVLSVVLSRIIYADCCKWSSGAARNEEEQRFSIFDTKEWKAVAPAEEEEQKSDS